MTAKLDRAPRLSEALASLPNAVIAVRTARRLSLRQAADEMGMSFMTLTRLEKGENCTLGHLVAAARWIEEPSNAAPTKEGE